MLKHWFPIKIPDRVIKGEFNKWESENEQVTTEVCCTFSESHLLNSPLMTLSGILIGNQSLRTFIALVDASILASSSVTAAACGKADSWSDFPFLLLDVG